MKPTQIKNFIAFVKGTQIGYNEVAKDRFKRESCEILRQIARLMGLQPGAFRVRFNAGGIAVEGDPILHSDPIDGRRGIYVNMAPSSGGGNFYYRSCASRKDFTGGRNRWMRLDDLSDLQKVAEAFKEAAFDNEVSR